MACAMRVTRSVGLRIAGAMTGALGVRILRHRGDRRQHGGYWLRGRGRRRGLVASLQRNVAVGGDDGREVSRVGANLVVAKLANRQT